MRVKLATPLAVLNFMELVGVEWRRDLDSFFRRKILIYMVLYNEPKSVYPHMYPNTRLAKNHY
ncbi:MAG TPA: hypothetical protein DDZ38_12210 [Gammaproteobacteria bacterium]|nr:hypothetical protein [Gammaproteobacteria bacterium]